MKPIKSAFRLGLDARMYRHTGIGEYISQLIRRMPKYLPRVSWTIFGDLPVRNLPKGARLVKTRVPIYGVAEQAVIPALAAGKGLSVFFSPHYNAPLMVSSPLLVTVHDLIHLRFPQYLPSPRIAARAYAWLMLKTACAKARVVVTISRNTARDLSRMLNVPPGKIRVVPLGVDEAYSPVRERGMLTRFRKRLGIEREYLLYVGNLRPHKNVAALVRAFAALKRAGLKLVLAGREDPRYGEVRSLVRSLGVADRVVFVPNTTVQERRLLYAGAEVFVFPSLYEGFGLPPLEAMACGTPVVASDASSIPEVTGDAAVSVDPRNGGALVRAVRRVLESRDLRVKLSKRGLARARAFSWETTARKTAEIASAVRFGRGNS